MSQQGQLHNVGTGAAAIETLTGNTGGPVGPDASFNINILGNNTTGINVVGMPGTNTLSIVGIQATTTQRGTVYLATDAEAIAGTDAINALTSSNLTAKLGAQTLNGLPIGAGPSAALSWTANPTDGQILIGDTGSTPVLGNLTSLAGTITITNGPGTINLDLSGGGVAIDQINVDAHTAPGTDPVVPTATGEIVVTGGQVATGTIGANVIRTNSLSANTYTIEIQRTTAVAATDSTKNGVSHFDSARFTVDANGFVSLNASGAGETITGNSGGALNPTAGNWNILGASTAAGTSPVSTSGAVSTLTVNVQKAQAIAATDATKIGLCNFDSARFTVDANGFVSLNASGAGETITGDSGGALNPSSGNWNILGRSGSKTSGSGSTLTIKSPPYADQGGSTTVTLNSGSFATAAITLTLPASAGLADGDLFEFVCTSASALVIQSVSAQKIRIGSLISSAAGTATSTSIGDALVLRFRATDGFFYATSIIGTWLVA